MNRFSLARFNFPLDPQRIANTPARPRDSARLLITDRRKSTMQHAHITDLAHILKRGDVLVINTTKVFPARVQGKKSTGGLVEILLLHQQGKNWICVGKGLRVGVKIHCGRGLSATVISHSSDNTWVLKWNMSGARFWKIIEHIGSVPIPPYIHPSSSRTLKSDYQTAFAKQRGSAAAPTAGLHFTPTLLKKLKKKGIQFIPVTLHVGWGTFAPIHTTDIRQHSMHHEWGYISQASWMRLVQARKNKQRIIAVGTTALRVVEAAARTRSLSQPGFRGWISLYLIPGQRLKYIQGLLTNFHLPKTSLFVLVCSLLGTARAQHLYQLAQQEHYRWASFGDAMLILPRQPTRAS